MWRHPSLIVDLVPALRIDFVITELFVGGAERCLTDLAIGLAQRGEKVRVASIGSLPEHGQTQLVQRLRDANIELYSADCDRFAQVLRARKRLRDWMRRDRADVVQTMLFHANVVGTMAAEAASVGVIVGGVRVAEPFRIRMMIEARALRRMSAVVCVSESVQSFVREKQCVRTPLHVIPNSIDLAEWDEGGGGTDVKRATMPAGSQGDASFGLNAEPPTLLFVGRLHPQKGLELLFEALPSLLADHPDMTVTIVGDGPLRDWVVDRAATISSDRIAVTGWRSDVKVLMKRCRLLVLPSRYEGMPNVVMEAMASSRPVAVARVEGVNELLREVANDQTFEPGNSAELAALIDQLWRDPVLASSLGKRNRELIAANHSREAMLDAYQTLYRSLLASRT